MEGVFPHDMATDGFVNLRYPEGQKGMNTSQLQNTHSLKHQINK